MLKISRLQMEGFSARARANLAARLYAEAGDLTDYDGFVRYIDECMRAGVNDDRGVWTLSLLLAEADRSGRPAQVNRLLADRNVEPALKVYQVDLLLNGEVE